MVTTPQTGDEDRIPEIPITAVTRTIGRMQEFNPANETVTAYLEQFQLFVTANSIEDDKLVPTLLTVLGSEHYSLLRGLVSPDLPMDKTFDDLVAILKKHYDPEPIVIAKRFHFYQRSQGSSESIGDYLANLRRLASHCKFSGFLGEALRDRLVCGMQSENTQKVLLTKANLTLDKALEISQGMELIPVKGHAVSHRQIWTTNVSQLEATRCSRVQPQSDGSRLVKGDTTRLEKRCQGDLISAYIR